MPLMATTVLHPPHQMVYGMSHIFTALTMKYWAETENRKKTENGKRKAEHLCQPTKFQNFGPKKGQM
jgi:hypothetical protein